jgi:hypothetical protein
MELFERYWGGRGAWAKEKWLGTKKELDRPGNVCYNGEV